MEDTLKELLYIADSVTKRCLCLHRSKGLSDPVRNSLNKIEQAISEAQTEIWLNKQNKD
jgi:hypothetical protein